MEERDYTDILNKIFICLIVIIAVLVMNLIYDVAMGSKGSTTSNKPTENTETAENDYLNDVAKMNEVDYKKALELFASEKAEIIFFGRDGCGACKAFAPIVVKLQDELGFKANYVNINMERDDSFDELIKKMSIKTTLQIDGKDVEDTIGNFQRDYGFTPTVIVVKDGKMVDGFVGALSESGFRDTLKKNGIE